MGEAIDQFSLLNSEIVVKDEKVTILHHVKGSVHLLGTHHNRENSARAVDELIRIVRPHIVAVELCRTNLERYNQLNDLNDGASSQQQSAAEAAAAAPLTSPMYDEFAARRSRMDIVPLRLKDKVIGEELLLALVSESIKYDRNCVYRNRLKKQFAQKNAKSRRFRVRPKIFRDVVIGREMTVPFRDYTWSLEKPNSRYLVNAATKYRILLADKPVEETFCSIASALSDEERSIIHIYQSNFLKLFVASSSNKTIMMDMLERNSKLYDAVVRERDEYMARSLRQALDDADARPPRDKARVVAIVGKNHITGIVKHWNNVLCKPRKVRPSTRTKR